MEQIITFSKTQFERQLSSRYIWVSSVPRRLKLGEKDDVDGEYDEVDKFDDLVGIYDINDNDQDEDADNK